MKHILILLAALSLAASLPAKTETYTIDPVHSSAGFSIRHLFSKFSSSFTKTTGTIVFDAADPAGNSVDATIEVASLNTANADRDKHLFSDAFFNLPSYPTITFKSKKWVKTGEDAYDITGDLTMRGVTREVVLKAHFLGTGPGLQPGTFTSGWEVTTQLNRFDFGIAYGPKVLGDEVQVNISIEAGYKK
jgi:polyisoprenoid-binding protein YceI